MKKIIFLMLLFCALPNLASWATDEEELGVRPAKEGRRVKIPRDAAVESQELINKYTRAKQSLGLESRSKDDLSAKSAEPVSLFPKSNGEELTTVVLPKQDPDFFKNSSTSKTDLIILTNDLQIDGVVTKEDSKGLWIQTDPGVEIYFKKEEIRQRRRL